MEESKLGDWAQSEMEKGTSRDGFLCCNKSSGTSCQPFPVCCNCEKNNSLLTGAGKINDNDLELHLENIPKVEILHN